MRGVSPSLPDIPDGGSPGPPHPHPGTPPTPTLRASVPRREGEELERGGAGGQDGPPHGPPPAHVEDPEVGFGSYLQ